MSYIVKWDSSFRDEYQWGSLINFKQDGTIHFENELMPPGLPIASWNSNSNYQASRTLIGLPLLKRNNKYRLEIEATSVPEKKFFIKIIFFDRNDNWLDSVIIRDKIGEFIYPEKAFYYKIEILNKRLHEFTFKQIIIDNVS